MLVANAEADGGLGRLAAVVYEKRGKHVLNESTRDAARDADKGVEGKWDHGGHKRWPQRQQWDDQFPHVPRVHAACNEVRQGTDLCRMAKSKKFDREKGDG